MILSFESARKSDKWTVPMDGIAVAGVVIAGIAAIAAGIVVAPTSRSSRLAKVAENIAQFKRHYDELRRTQVSLNEDALRISPTSWRHGEIPLLVQAGWIPDRPMPLTAISLRLQEDGASVDELVDRSRILKGLDLSGPIAYSKAITEIAGMDHFTNGSIYRPVSVDPLSQGLRIEFELARYFEYLDTSEILSYEKSCGRKKCAYREKLGSPFDFRNRVSSLGILTLTLQRGQAGSTFMMHRRNSEKVVLGSDLFHVVPAGEFTPSDISLESARNDLSLWRNIAREYSEELLGTLDAQGQGGRRIDYSRDFPYGDLAHATSSGSLQIFVLGLGLDPLSWKPELLTVAIFKKEVFKAIFGDDMKGNYEGTIIEDIEFTEENVQHYVRNSNTRLGAKACLQLAWKNRIELGAL
jgi:hypothetical protein